MAAFYLQSSIAFHSMCIMCTYNLDQFQNPNKPTVSTLNQLNLYETKWSATADIPTSRTSNTHSENISMASPLKANKMLPTTLKSFHGLLVSRSHAFFLFVFVIWNIFRWFLFFGQLPRGFFSTLVPKKFPIFLHSLFCVDSVECGSQTFFIWRKCTAS